MEPQGTVLLTIMDSTLAQGIKTMMHMVAIVQRATQVPGGIVIATVQTSMVSTMVVDDTHLMVLPGKPGMGITPSNSLK